MSIIIHRDEPKENFETRTNVLKGEGKFIRIRFVDIQHYLLFQIIHLIRIFSRRFQSTLINIDFQMNKLNNNGQFHQTINLYEDQSRKQIKQNNNVVANQALKPCTETNDIKRGKNIHEYFSSMGNNHFI